MVGREKKTDRCAAEGCFLFMFLVLLVCLQSDKDWLGKDDEKLTGFSWRGGSEPETTGIQLWSEVFTVQKSDGTEVLTSAVRDKYSGCHSNFDLVL